ncbi:DUF3084 domain-containing protein [Synechococcus sp. Cruz CV12-2-Slac-r]|uniref:DUF3084 domain-containing protein n=1 Tax=Synechococcus sp. Cruz CV12-2-Slac-r TaxID=2823748 RepID=UPI0020CE8832|nr:DUF3084 domain-containing protein [Synechococcus sp. Cruz CV12-2-Slac-r]MCP9940323.1 DUF3084 domain-containing protein [Synechococcus sp. Cruz CV12-2-Slac-r]
MTGWLLILAVLLLGGVLATIGDRLGSRIGKARLSLFRLRPRSTAVLITVLTGSLISALTLGLMLAVSEQLRIGLFQLDKIESKLSNARKNLDFSVVQLTRSEKQLNKARKDVARADQGRAAARQQLQQVQARAIQLRAELTPLQARRKVLEQERDRLGKDVKSRDAELRVLQQRTSLGQQELKQLEGKVLALRSGDVVLSTGQALTTARIAIPQQRLVKKATEDLLREANLRAFEQVLPGQQPNRQLLLIPRSEVAKVEQALSNGATWVVSIRSAGNVLRGETQVLAFADVRPNQKVVSKGEVLASISFDPNERSPQQVQARLNLLLAAARTETLRQGSLAPAIQFDVEAFKAAGRALSEQRGRRPVLVQVVSVRDSDTADPVFVELRGVNLDE